MAVATEHNQNQNQNANPPQSPPVTNLDPLEIFKEKDFDNNQWGQLVEHLRRFYMSYHLRASSEFRERACQIFHLYTGKRVSLYEQNFIEFYKAVGLEDLYGRAQVLDITKLTEEEIATVENLFVQTAEKLCVSAGPQITVKFPDWDSPLQAKKEVKKRIFKHTPAKYQNEVQKFWNKNWPDAADDS